MEPDAGDDERWRREAWLGTARPAGTANVFGGSRRASSGAAQLNKIFRALIILVALALISAVCILCLPSAQEPPKPPAATFQISGSVRNGKILLPGVAVTAANTLTGKKYSV